MNDFMFGRADAGETVATLRRLADDLENLTMFVPSRQLDIAPRLENWTYGTRLTTCLGGEVTDHPVLGTRPVLSSELFAIDPKRRWARTFTRFYVLGERAGLISGDSDHD
jgi:hypothetical protein